eukprot:m.68196 g.68196  ORF g.68196 m.68196 type:complete len:122 (-) comp13887_c0_seq1:169-534(-)
MDLELGSRSLIVLRLSFLCRPPSNYNKGFRQTPTQRARKNRKLRSQRNQRKPVKLLRHSPDNPINSKVLRKKLRKAQMSMRAKDMKAIEGPAAAAAEQADAMEVADAGLGIGTTLGGPSVQ